MGCQKRNVKKRQKKVRNCINKKEDTKKLAKDLKEANAENSERANFLSRYIDEQTKKLDEQIDAQLKKIKLLRAKLTEQVKEQFQAEELNLMQMKNEITNHKEEFNTKILDLDACY